MAFHEPPPGHTPPVVGGIYDYPSGRGRFLWTLQRYNPLTGLCFLLREPSYGGSRWISVGALRTWHLLRYPVTPKDTP